MSKSPVPFLVNIIWSNWPIFTRLGIPYGKDISQSYNIDDLKRRITEAVAAVTCGMLNECGKSWIIDFTSATSHVGLTSSACKVWK
jgi:hypothetical protein